VGYHMSRGLKPCCSCSVSGEISRRIRLLDRFLACGPGIAAAEIPRVQAPVQPANLRCTAAVIGLTSGWRVFVAGVRVPDAKLVTIIAAQTNGSCSRCQEDALEALRLELEATAQQIALARALDRKGALAVLPQHPTGCLHVMAEFVGYKPHVPEPREGVRLVPVVGAHRPVDGPGGRAIVSRRIPLAEPSARCLDRAAVRLHPRSAELYSARGERLGKALHQAADQLLPVPGQLGILQRWFRRTHLDGAGGPYGTKVYGIDAVLLQRCVGLTGRLAVARLRRRSRYGRLGGRSRARSGGGRRRASWCRWLYPWYPAARRATTAECCEDQSQNQQASNAWNQPTFCRVTVPPRTPQRIVPGLRRLVRRMRHGNRA
jgi:hypothetical protein